MTTSACFLSPEKFVNESWVICRERRDRKNKSRTSEVAIHIQNKESTERGEEEEPLRLISLWWSWRGLTVGCPCVSISIQAEEKRRKTKREKLRIRGERKEAAQWMTVPMQKQCEKRGKRLYSIRQKAESSYLFQRIKEQQAIKVWVIPEAEVSEKKVLLLLLFLVFFHDLLDWQQPELSAWRTVENNLVRSLSVHNAVPASNIYLHSVLYKHVLVHPVLDNENLSRTNQSIVLSMCCAFEHAISPSFAVPQLL